MRKRTLNKLIKDEKGQALIIVMILMLVGGLIVAPMLAHVGSGVKAGKDVYEERMQLFYAADSGVQDALWQIKHEQLPNLFGAGYDEYNYDDPYPYPDSLMVNGKDVDVTIGNVWVPMGISVPSPSEARDIIKGTGGNPPSLIIVGGLSGTGGSTYQIKITYYYGSSDPTGTNLKVDKIGIWLPPGFGYDGNCSLANDPDTDDYAVPAVTDYKSGKAVVWSFSSLPLWKFAPDSTSSPMGRSFTFKFTGPAGQSPGIAISWIETSNVTALIIPGMLTPRFIRLLPRLPMIPLLRRSRLMLMPIPPEVRCAKWALPYRGTTLPWATA